MIPIAKIVEEIIKNSFFLEEALALGIINLSALAEILIPKIEEKILKRPSKGSVIVALKRLKEKEKKKKKELLGKIKEMFHGRTDLSLKTNILEITFLNSPSFDRKLQKILERKAENFLILGRGTFETTAILDKALERFFKGEKIVKKLENLASITIKLPEEALTTPGVYSYFLKILFWEGINVIEIVSTFRQLNIILENKDLEKALSAINRALH